MVCQLCAHDALVLCLRRALDSTQKHQTMCVGDLQAPMHTRALATLKVQRVKTQLQRGKQSTYIAHQKPTRSSVMACLSH